MKSGLNHVGWVCNLNYILSYLVKAGMNQVPIPVVW